MNKRLSIKSLAESVSRCQMYQLHTVQQSLANAKVSAWQQRIYEGP